MQNLKILLASNSPRRKELLQDLGFEFEVVSVHCDEIFPKDLPASEVAAFVSLAKAEAFRNPAAGEVLITADTVVVLDNEILGKPRHAQEARKMLSRLSGNVHQVYTGITVKTKSQTFTKTDVANVFFYEITDSEIDYYIKNYAPFDKAGSYGIQEWLGMAKIRKIEGSYYTIMGLPTHLIYTILTSLQAN